MPATEDTAQQRVNVYARTRVEGEQLIVAAQCKGLRACMIRLSNVFGTTGDHQDRVVPAFAHAAVLGHTLRIDGAGHTLDFTHLDDVIRGITALIRLLQAGGEVPPPIHFVSGCSTTLGQLANMAIDIAGSGSSLMHAPPRNFDVAQFYGLPERASQFLGWSPRISLREGLTWLINDFQEVLKLARKPLRYE